MSRIISASEVKKHNKSNSVWIIIHNNVYDVTDYVEEHPGGVEAIMEAAGQDGTQAFEDVAHSDDAREILAQFKIGTLPKDEKTSIPVCLRLPAKQKPEKTWNTFDRPCSREKKDRLLSATCTSKERKPSVCMSEGRRVNSVVVPRESNNLKWAVMALAGALVLGIILKKYLA